MSIDVLAGPRSTRAPVSDPDCAACPLRGLGVFEPCSPEELAFIDELKQAELTHPPGTTLIAEGDEDAPLFTLREGWALRYKTLADGRRQVLQVLLPGDFIGLQQRMSDAALHGVQTLTPVRVCRFRRDAVWRLHQERPSLGYDVTWLATHDNTLLDENLLSVGQRSALERMAALLLTLYQRAAPFDPRAARDGVLFPLTQRHLADALGLSLVHTHRTLRTLRARDLIELTDPRGEPRLRLPDPAALAQLALLCWPLKMSRRPLI